MDHNDPTMYDEQGRLRPTEAGRLKQGGMGYAQWHAAVTWIRTWLQAIGATYTEHGDPGWKSALKWEITTDEGPFWITFDHGSYGHLLYGLDGEAWDGMDVTYHPPTTETRWDMLLRRITRMRTTGGPEPKTRTEDYLFLSYQGTSAVTRKYPEGMSTFVIEEFEEWALANSSAEAKLYRLPKFEGDATLLATCADGEVYIPEGD